MEHKEPHIDEDVNLAEVGQKLSGFADRIAGTLYSGFLFLKRNIVTLGALFVLGAGLGLYLDKTNKTYDNHLIVTPNFGSVDYLYAKIDLIKAKIKERDTLFLKKAVGIKKPKKISDIEIEPINDVYRFVEGSERNFELIKLMAEDGSIDQIVKDPATAKNYLYHEIVITTAGKMGDAEAVQPILDYLNNSSYYNDVKEVTRRNIMIKMQKNDSLIRQIDELLERSVLDGGASKGGNLMYYNQENSQLNDVLKTKDQLIGEQGLHRIALISNDKVIKDSSRTGNIRNTEAVNGKLKFVLPFVFAALFALFSAIRNFLRIQKTKRADV